MIGTVISMNVPESDYWNTDFGVGVTVPVAKPLLPTLADFAPYLQRIEHNRWYSNGGPLVREFEERLAVRTGGDVATVANATVGLALALMAQGAGAADAPFGALCMMPAWTFAATAHAARMAGLVPWLVDVDPVTWALEAPAARELLRVAPGPVAAVMPVAPFGQPIDAAPWEVFREETGVPVVIDAAAAFDTVRALTVPVVVSLHATKAMGIGEGGFVVSTRAAFIDEVRQRANFGFWNSREATVHALNGKISEYAAGVGLAGLDGWSETRAALAHVGGSYRAALAAGDGVALQPGFAENWVSTTVMITVPQAGGGAVSRALSAAGIGTRHWWGGGLHRHAAFRSCPSGTTAVTDALAAATIGLPCWPDLPDDVIGRVCAVVLAVCADAGLGGIAAEPVTAA
jgi:dTDP-4-amino-4,6-dideoxygalactose transaminase